MIRRNYKCWRHDLRATGSGHSARCNFSLSRQENPVIRTVQLGPGAPISAERDWPSLTVDRAAIVSPSLGVDSLVDRTGEFSPRDRFLTKLKKEKAKRRRAERRAARWCTRGWRGLGRVGAFCEPQPETAGDEFQKNSAFSSAKKEIKRNARVSSVGATRATWHVYVHARQCVVKPQGSSSLRLSSSLSLLLAGASAGWRGCLSIYRDFRRVPSVTRQPRNGRLTFHASIHQPRKGTETPRGAPRGTLTSRRFSCCDRHRMNVGERPGCSRSSGKDMSGTRHLRARGSRNSFMPRWAWVTRLGIFVFEMNTREETRGTILSSNASDAWKFRHEVNNANISFTLMSFFLMNFSNQSKFA